MKDPWKGPPCIAGHCSHTPPSYCCIPLTPLQCMSVFIFILWQNGAGDSGTFKQYEVVQSSRSVYSVDHFNTDMKSRLVKSDLIVEICEDSTVATATAQLSTAAADGKTQSLWFSLTEHSERLLWVLTDSGVRTQLSQYYTIRWQLASVFPYFAVQPSI